jgi:hypothetical protein
MKYLLQFGPALIVFLTVLLSVVITTEAAKLLIIPVIVLIGIAFLWRYLFGPYR